MPEVKVSVSNPISAVAEAISNVAKMINKWFDGTKGRRTRKALINARRGFKRALLLHPELKDDKAFNKYQNGFQKYVTIN
jgi:hypothetical protein